MLSLSENFRLCPVKSRIVLEDTLKMKRAWINLISLDLKDHPG